MEIQVLIASLKEMFIFFHSILNHLNVTYATLTKTQVSFIAHFKVRRSSTFYSLIAAFQTFL